MRISDWSSDVCSSDLEMRHYSKNNVEALTASWLLYDGELSKLKQAGRIANLMDRQNELHAALEKTIAEFEDVLEKMKPPPEIGRAACGERVGQYVYISVDDEQLKKK